MLKCCRLGSKTLMKPVARVSTGLARAPARPPRPPRCRGLPPLPARHLLRRPHPLLADLPRTHRCKTKRVIVRYCSNGCSGHSRYSPTPLASRAPEPQHVCGVLSPVLESSISRNGTLQGLPYFASHLLLCPPCAFVPPISSCATHFLLCRSQWRPSPTSRYNRRSQLAGRF